MVQSSLMHRLSWILKTLLLLLLLSYSCLNIVVTARSDCLLCHGNSVVAQWVECQAIGRTVPLVKPPQSPHCYVGAADHMKTFPPTPGHTASPVLSHLSGRLDPIALKPFDLAQVCHENKICSKLALTWKLTLKLAFSAHCISNWKLNGISRTNISKVTWNAANEHARCSRDATDQEVGENCAVEHESVVQNDPSGWSPYGLAQRIIVVWVWTQGRITWQMVSEVPAATANRLYHSWTIPAWNGCARESQGGTAWVAVRQLRVAGVSCEGSLELASRELAVCASKAD